MIWTEEAIRNRLGDAFFSMLDREMSGPIVVDLNRVTDAPHVSAAKAAPVVEPIKHRPDGYLWMEDIARVVCRAYGVTRADFMSIRRKQKMVNARQVFYWLAKRYTAHSFPMIGSWCGKDHSTVLHGVEKIEKRFAEYRPILESCALSLGVELEERQAA